MPFNYWLFAGGVLSGIASLMHIAIIIGGPDWYRFFGAAEGMALAAERGAIYPAFVTLGIAMVLAVWALCGFAGAGLVKGVPFLRPALVAISTIYLVRALAPIPMLMVVPDKLNAFAIWSSLIVLIYGIAYAVGTWKAWPNLSAIA